MRKKLLVYAAFGSSFIWAPYTFAQSSDQPVRTDVNIFNNPALDNSLFEFSYESPNSPVLPLVGVSNDQIARVDTVRKFGIALLNGLGSTDVGPAVAIDVSPFWLLSRRPISLSDFQNFSAANRIVARARVGMAVSQGEEASNRPSTLVLSLSTKLFDGADKLADKGFSECLSKTSVYEEFDRMHNDAAIELAKLQKEGKTHEEIAAHLANAGKIDSEAEKASFAKIEIAHAACVVEQSKRMATRSSFDAGFGMRFNGDAGRFRDFDDTGAIFWATWSSGVIGNPSPATAKAGPLNALRVQAIAHARYTLKEAVYDEKFVPLGKRNTLMLVGGIESVPNLDPSVIERFRWSIQGGWNKQNAILSTDEDKDYWRYQATANFKVLPGIWLNATVGRVSGKGVRTDTKALIGFSFSPPSEASKITEYNNNRNQ